MGVFGRCVHGLFHNDGLRRVVVRNAAGRKGVSLPRSGESFSQDAEFDKLAHPVRTSLNMDAVYESMGGRRGVRCKFRIGRCPFA